MSQILVRLALLATILPALSCARVPRWVVSPTPTREEVEILLETGRATKLPPQTLAVRDIPDIPVREKLRPCCAFGSELRASVAGIPIPGYRIPNLIGPEQVGPHTYDSGAFAATSDGHTSPGFGTERNGLVYTCYGGFIDTAHVRDYVDWALFFAAQVGRRAVDGGEIALPDEGGTRRVVVRPLPAQVIERYGFKESITALAQWLTFQVSIWHEIATWFGWASLAGFSERASAFSPEDLYSNMLGTKLMLAITARREASSEFSFNRAVDGWFGRALELLGAVPSELGSEVTQALDGLWWDSSRRLPDPQLVQRRHFGIGDPVSPWLAPETALPEAVRQKLAAACGADRTPVEFANPAGVKEIDLGDYASLEIEVDDGLAKQEPFATRGRRLTQRDFPEIVAAVREQARAELGPRVDQPD